MQATSLDEFGAVRLKAAKHFPHAVVPRPLGGRVAVVRHQEGVQGYTALYIRFRNAGAFFEGEKPRSCLQ